MSTYKFMKVSRFYPGFLKSYYKENKKITQCSYNEQYQHIMNQGYGWSDYLSRGLKSLGVECLDVVANALPLQNTWAKENSTESTGAQLVLEQIKKFKPDVLLIQDTVTIDAHWCIKIREAVPSIRLLMGWQCAPYSISDLDFFKQFDLLLTCNTKLEEEFNAGGIRTWLMAHAFESSLYSRHKSDTLQDNQVLFAGSVTLGKGFHDGRLKFLSDLYEAGVPIKICGERPSPLKGAVKQSLGYVAQVLKGVPGLKFVKSRSAFSRALLWKEINVWPPELRALSPYWHKPLFGQALLREISTSAINLNFHIDSAGDYAGNARLFEVTGMGSCLVTDLKKNLPTLFFPDEEVVTYSSTEECIEKTRWLMDQAAMSVMGN